MKIDIKKYRIIKLLKSLNKAERSSFSRFLDSPYHNRRTDVKELYEQLQIYLEKGKLLSKEELWQKCFAQKAFDDRQLRYLMSYLSKLFEQFITVEASLSNAFTGKMELVRHLGRRFFYQLQESSLREAKKVLDKQPYQQAEYLFQSYEYCLEQAQLSSAYRPDQSPDFPALEQAFEQAVLAMKMRQKVWSLNLQTVYKKKEKSSLLDRFVNDLDLADIGDHPAILIYWHAAQFLEHSRHEQHFQYFKSLLFSHSAIFPHEEARELYLLAINFGVHRINQGQKSFSYDVLDLYKAGLKQAYLLTNGVLSRFTYHNIVTAALQIDETAWAKSFSEEWMPKLERRFRERMYNFCRAKIAYATQEYDEALALLQQSNYHDLLLNLGARTLLLKIFFDQKEWDALDSHLDAFNVYLRRKAGLSYQLIRYQNLIRFTKKILNIKFQGQPKIDALKKQLVNEKILTERNWLLACLE